MTPGIRTLAERVLAAHRDSRVRMNANGNHCQASGFDRFPCDEWRLADAVLKSLETQAAMALDTKEGM